MKRIGSDFFRAWIKTWQSNLPQRLACCKLLSSLFRVNPAGPVSHLARWPALDLPWRVAKEMEEIISIPLMRSCVSSPQEPFPRGSCLQIETLAEIPSVCPDTQALFTGFSEPSLPLYCRPSLFDSSSEDTTMSLVLSLPAYARFDSFPTLWFSSQTLIKCSSSIPRRWLKILFPTKRTRIPQ